MVAGVLALTFCALPLAIGLEQLAIWIEDAPDRAAAREVRKIEMGAQARRVERRLAREWSKVHALSARNGGTGKRSGGRIPAPNPTRPRTRLV